MQDQSLNWGKWVCLCIDQAASMAGCHSDATAKTKKVANKNLLSTHCMYRYKHVAFQKLSPKLNNVMTRPVKIISYL